jgi:hypothetical protein
LGQVAGAPRASRPWDPVAGSVGRSISATALDHMRAVEEAERGRRAAGVIGYFACMRQWQRDRRIWAPAGSSRGKDGGPVWGYGLSALMMCSCRCACPPRRHGRGRSSPAAYLEGEGRFCRGGSWPLRRRRRNGRVERWQQAGRWLAKTPFLFVLGAKKTILTLALELPDANFICRAYPVGSLTPSRLPTPRLLPPLCPLSSPCRPSQAFALRSAARHRLVLGWCFGPP